MQSYRTRQPEIMLTNTELLVRLAFNPPPEAASVDVEHIYLDPPVCYKAQDLIVIVKPVVSENIDLGDKTFRFGLLLDQTMAYAIRYGCRTILMSACHLWRSVHSTTCSVSLSGPFRFRHS